MIWLNGEKLTEIGISRGVFVRNKANWSSRDTGKRGRNGKPVIEYLLESLPLKYQQAYLQLNGSLTTEQDQDAGVGPGVEEAAAQADGGERRLVEALARYKGDARDKFLAEAQRLSLIVEKYSRIEPKRVRTHGGKYEYSQAVIDLCYETVCTDPAILAIEPSRSKARSPHAIEAWAKRVKQDGLATFLRSAPKPTGKADNRLAEISAGAREWIDANWRKKPSPDKLYQELKRVAGRKGWKIPSRGYIWRLYQDIPPVVDALVFKGDKTYQSKYSPFVPRTVEDLGPLQILCGDHSVRDVSVVLPNGELTRPWLTLWLDLRTYLIWGWHLDLTPSSSTIGLAYVNGVQTFGAQPLSNLETGYVSYLYTDQGKDYRSKTLTGQTLEFKNAARIEGGLGTLCTHRDVGFMREMGLQHILARGYNAKEKPVERVHKDISSWEQNHFASEYCGDSPSKRPDAWRNAFAKHERLRKKFADNIQWVVSESPFMTLEDYRDNLAEWIHRHNTIAHRRSVLGGASLVPMQEYERLYTTRYEISDDALALMLMKTVKRRLGKNGVQLFQQQWHFWADEMSVFKGRDIDVEVRYTDGDYSRVWVVLPKSRFGPEQVVEAARLERSSIIDPNKKTLGDVAKMKANEKRLVRDYTLLEQSKWRGETVEDRYMATQDVPEDPQPEEQRMAVNAQPRVIAVTKFDLNRSSSGRSGVTADQVEKAPVIEGMFGKTEAAATPRIREEWEAFADARETD